MHILVLLHTDYSRSNYHEAIDHNRHIVSYLGKEKFLLTIPLDYRHTALPIEKEESFFDSFKRHYHQLSLSIDRVVYNSESTVVVAGKINNYLSLPGISYERAVSVTDKVIMKEKILQHPSVYLLCPEFMSLSQFIADRPRSRKIFNNKKIVVKPKSGSGSEGVQIFDDLLSAENAINQRKEYKEEPQNYEIEEYISGEINHLDAVVRNNRVIEYVPCKYFRSCYDYICGKPYGSLQLPKRDLYLRIIDSVIASLSINTGVIHLEIINSARGFYFLEIANRSGGGLIRDMFSKRTSINLSATEISLQIDESIIYLRDEEAKDYYYGSFLYPGHLISSKRAEIHGIDLLNENENILELYTNECLLDIDQVTYRADKLPLAGLVKAKTSDELEKNMNSIFNNKSIYIA